MFQRFSWFFEIILHWLSDSVTQSIIFMMAISCLKRSRFFIFPCNQSTQLQGRTITRIQERQTNSNFQQFGRALVREQTWCGRSFTRLGNRLYCSNGVGGLVLTLADIAIGPRLLCIPPASATMLTPMSKENDQVQHSQEYLCCLIKASGFTMWMTSSTQK